ncbi:helix-turn-helix domain-containing protein [Metabacillus arenae]|uniref:AraC family transcriptional regulator n=1 Tax=Metabacillus arenae TaxID=2771434 RepID=A0A926NA50_9BACI|nr:helix-turn-helix transcriptional regulator [Metabacillus arenae]MBD1379604.1 AraC family transcriptional regulator [Metabacillus arenae]
MENKFTFANAKRLPAIDWNIRFFGAHTQTVSNNWSVPKEFHYAFEILLVMNGEQETLIENERYLLKNGDIILIPPGFHHANKCISESSMTYFCAHFDVDEPTLRMEMMKHCDLIYNSDSPFYQRLYTTLQKWIDIINESNINEMKYKLKTQIPLFELLEIFADIVSQKKDPIIYESMTTAKYAKEIADAIKRNFKENSLNGNDYNELRIQPIIASLGISPNYGLQIFQKIYRMSPRKYLSELKLQEAKILIQQPDISLSEIATRLGYKNLSHFSRQFKKWTGLNPSEYRKNYFYHS